MTSTSTPTPIMLPLSVGLSLLLISTCLVAGAGGLSCNSGEVAKRANGCFSNYNREFQHIQQGPTRLCCGVDVETLRAFCSSYVNAMTCITGLKKQCPRSPAIGESMRNLHGAEGSLKALCSDDTIIEKYALYQSCLTREGPTTNRCFQRYLNTSDAIQLLTSVDNRHIAEFCSDMRSTLECIQNNVRNRCGADAAALAGKLVKPMVRESTKCDYSIVTKAPVSRQGQPSPSSHDGSWQRPSSASCRASFSSALLVAVAVSVLRTFFVSL